MPRNLRVQGVSINQGGAGATVRYFALGNTWIDSNLFTSTIANAQVPYYTGGTIGGFELYINANTLDGPLNVGINVNGVASIINLTVPTGTTGWFKTMVTRLSIAPSDLVCGYVDAGGATTGSYRLKVLATHFTPAKNLNVTKHIAHTNTIPTGSGVTVYYGFAGRPQGANLTEDNALITFGTPARFKNLYIYSSANTWTANIDVGNMKDGGGGAVIVTLPAGTPGGFSNVTDVDSYNQGQTGDYYRAIGAGSGSFQMQIMSCEIETDNKKFLSIFSTANNSIAQAIDLVRWSAIGGASTSFDTAEADVQVEAQMKAKISYLHVRASSNTNDENATFLVRKNGQDTALSVTITALTPGIYTKTDTTITVEPEDLINVQSTTAGTVGTIAYRTWGVTMENLERRVSPGQVR